MGNPILEVLEFDEKRGVITFKGVRYLLIRPETKRLIVTVNHSPLLMLLLID